MTRIQQPYINLTNLQIRKASLQANYYIFNKKASGFLETLIKGTN